MRAALLLLGAAASLLIVSAQETQECHQCYTLVSQAVEEHRQRLSKLDELLRGIGSDISPAEDSEFRRRHSFLRIKIKALYDDAERAVSRDSSSLLILGDLQERVEELKKAAGSLLVYIQQAGSEASRAESSFTQAESIFSRLDAALRDTLTYLETKGRTALLRAIEQSKQFGLQSARMSEIAREARRLADGHQRDAEVLKARSATAVSNATAAYELTYTLLELQRNCSTEIRLLSSSLNSTEQLVYRTRSEAAEAQRRATEAYDAALKLYTDAGARFDSVNVAGLKRRADYVKAEAQRLKADLEALSEQHGPMLNDLQRNISSLKILIERGLSQQMLANELMNDVTAARDKARQAVSAGEKTLAEARKTLDTLLTFDRHVRESREEAEYALKQVEEITRMVQTAEWQTQEARLALQSANRNASAARDSAIEAEAVAKEAYTEVISIQDQTVITSERATSLRQEASRTELRVSEQTVLIGKYERQLTVDSALAREAKEKAGLAGGNARTAQSQVEAALRMVQEIMALLEAAGDLDLAALSELEARLSVAEGELDGAERLTKLDEFQKHRVEQDRRVTDYSRELEHLRREVENVKEIAEALPTGCYNRVTLEP